MGRRDMVIQFGFLHTVGYHQVHSSLCLKQRSLESIIVRMLSRATLANNSCHFLVICISNFLYRLELLRREDFYLLLVEFFMLKFKQIQSNKETVKLSP